MALRRRSREYQHYPDRVSRARNSFLAMLLGLIAKLAHFIVGRVGALFQIGGGVVVRRRFPQIDLRQFHVGGLVVGIRAHKWRVAGVLAVVGIATTVLADKVLIPADVTLPAATADAQVSRPPGA